MTLSRISLASICIAWSLTAAPLAWGQIANYSQDFEGLAVASDPGNSALGDDGWLVFGIVYDAAGNFIYQYGPEAAPNSQGNPGPAFSNVVAGEGGPEQQTQQLTVFSDYENGDHDTGRLIESSVFQEQPSITGAAGTSVEFRFDGKMGNIEGASIAIAFIKTLDPNNSFALSNFISLDTTTLPADWSTFGLVLDIDAATEGHFFQAGYSSISANREGSGNVYDNVTIAPAPVCPGEQVLANRTLATSSPQVRDAAVSATVGPKFTAAGSSIAVSAPIVILEDDVEIGGGFSAGNSPSSCGLT